MNAIVALDVFRLGRDSEPGHDLAHGRLVSPVRVRQCFEPTESVHQLGEPQYEHVIAEHIIITSHTASDLLRRGYVIAGGTRFHQKCIPTTRLYPVANKRHIMLTDTSFHRINFHIYTSFIHIHIYLQMLLYILCISI